MGIVTCFYNMTSKRTADSYAELLPRTLRLNASYLIFYEDEPIQAWLSGLRVGLPTRFVHRSITARNFSAITREFGDIPKSWHNAEHLPSNLYGRMASAKVSLLAAALPYFDNDTQWFVWVDAGIVEYRGRTMPTQAWPHPAALESLPKDKIVYTGERER